MGLLTTYPLHELKERYNTPVFFETGTAEGNGVRTAVQYGFSPIYTVEIIPDQVKKLRDKFITLLYDLENHVHLIEGDSYTKLQEYLPKINQNILFWLDAHYPGADLIQNDIPTKIEKYVGRDQDDYTLRLPLQAELELIAKLRSNYKDVILLDDLNIYSNQISPEAYWLMPKQRFTENFYKEVLKNTHNFVQINDTQGMLVPHD